jgi:hypothetical protein
VPKKQDVIEEIGCPSLLVEWDRASTITETFRTADYGAATRDQQHELLYAKKHSSTCSSSSVSLHMQPEIDGD